MVCFAPILQVHNFLVHALEPSLTLRSSIPRLKPKYDASSGNRNLEKRGDGWSGERFHGKELRVLLQVKIHLGVGEGFRTWFQIVDLSKGGLKAKRYETKDCLPGCRC